MRAFLVQDMCESLAPIVPTFKVGDVVKLRQMMDFYTVPSSFDDVGYYFNAGRIGRIDGIKQYNVGQYYYLSYVVNFGLGQFGYHAGVFLVSPQYLKSADAIEGMIWLTCQEREPESNTWFNHEGF